MLIQQFTLAVDGGSRCQMFLYWQVGLDDYGWMEYNGSTRKNCCDSV